MMNKCSIQYIVRFLLVALICSVPVVPVYSITSEETEQATAGNETKSASKTKQPSEKKKSKETGGFWKSLKKSLRKSVKKAKEEYGKHKVAYTVAGSLAGLCLFYLTYKYRVTLFPCLFGLALILNKKINIGGSECKGDEVQLNEKVSLSQVRVKQQGKTTCGYHTLKNYFLLANALSKDTGMGNLAERLNDSELVEKLFDRKNGTWRKIVYGKKGWIHSGEIQRLFNNECNWNELADKDIVYNFDIIDDVQIFDNSDFDDVTPHVRENLKNALGNPYIHGFAINTAKQSLNKFGKHMKSGGHWFLVLLYQKASGEREYIIADSANSKYYGLRLQDSRVEKLINTIEEWKDKK